MVPGASSLTERATRVGAIVTLGLRSVAVLLLGASAVLGAQAAWSRFAVCFVDADPPVGGLPADRVGACFAMQDNLYDYNVPLDPWVPIADAAQREGVSLLALGLAVVLVAVTVADRWFVRVIGAVIALLWLPAGVPPLLSGLAGEPVGSELLVGAGGIPLVLGLLGPLAPVVTIGLAVRAVSRPYSPHGRDVGRGVDDGLLVGLFWVAMTVAHPLIEWMIASALWSSHDSSPLSGLVRCTAVVIAAASVAALLIPAGKRRRFLRGSTTTEST